MWRAWSGGGESVNDCVIVWEDGSSSVVQRHGPQAARRLRTWIGRRVEGGASVICVLRMSVHLSHWKIFRGE